MGIAPAKDNSPLSKQPALPGQDRFVIFVKKGLMKRIYVIPTQGLPSDIGYLEIVAMSEEEVMKLPHELMAPFEFESEWNADIKGLFDSTKQFIRAF